MMLVLKADANRKVHSLWNIVCVITLFADCITEGYQSLNNATLEYLATLNQTLTCFEKNQEVENNWLYLMYVIFLMI